MMPLSARFLHGCLIFLCVATVPFASHGQQADPTQPCGAKPVAPPPSDPVTSLLKYLGEDFRLKRLGEVSRVDAVTSAGNFSTQDRERWTALHIPNAYGILDPILSIRAEFAGGGVLEVERSEAAPNYHGFAKITYSAPSGAVTTLLKTERALKSQNFTDSFVRTVWQKANGSAIDPRSPEFDLLLSANTLYMNVQWENNFEQSRYETQLKEYQACEDKAAAEAETKRKEEAQRQKEEQENAAAEKQRLEQIKPLLPKRKSLGDFVCSKDGTRLGYVERIAGDRVQIRVHHFELHFGSPNRDWDEFIWRPFNTVYVCGE